MIKNYILFLGLILTFIACKKEDTRWDTNWSAPLVKGKITVADALPDYTFENSDDYISLKYDDTVFNFNIDTIIKLPDTTLNHKTASPLAVFTLNPGGSLPGNEINQFYNLGDIELKRVIVEQGTGIFTIYSAWPGKTRVRFDFTKLKDKNGDPFVKDYFLEPGTEADPFVFVDSFEMEGFDFDLTGIDGNLFNNVAASMTVFSADENSFVITNLDTVELVMAFKDMTPRYARGYFGNYEVSDTTTIDFPELRKLSGILNLDSLDLSLKISNGFDVLAQSKITTFEGTNSNTGQTVALNFPLINEFINLNPATGGLWDHQASDYHLEINSQNSNCIPFIENFPDQLKFGYDILINPFGNTGGGTDQFFVDAGLNLFLDGELPLNIKMDNFTLTDTFSITIESIDETVDNGNLVFKYTNAFPLGAIVSLNLLDAQGNIINTIAGSSNLLTGTYDSNTATTSPTNGQIIFEFDADQISNLGSATDLMIEIDFDTYDKGFVKINMSDYIDFKLISNIQLNLSLK